MNMKTYTILSIVKAATTPISYSKELQRKKLRWCSYERNNAHVRARINISAVSN